MWKRRRDRKGGGPTSRGQAARPATEPATTPTEDQVTDAYEASYPSLQHQFDLFAGEWTSAVPTPGEETVSGSRDDLFTDERIVWALGELGSIEGADVLELGPLEASHTAMLERAGAGQVLAIEAHRRAFLRCLVVKNVLNLRATFLLGDFVAFLRTTQRTFEVCVASGVLYHMTDPLELLHLISEHSRRLILWTHYYDPEILVARQDVAARLSAGTADVAHGGYACTVHRYDYGQGPSAGTFCGGARTHAAWMDRSDILGALEHYGFGDIRINFDDPYWPHGPALALVATRR